MREPQPAEPRGGLDATMGGVFVSTATVFVSAGGGVFSVSTCSRLQPWMSMPMRPTTADCDRAEDGEFEA